MLDLSWFLTKTITEPLTPSVAQAYYELPLEQPLEQSVKIDPDTTIEGNCYLYVSQFVKLPLTRDILPSTTPFVGAVAIFQYKVPHYAVVKSLQEDGFVVKESNYTPGVIGERFIRWDDPHLRGFYYPSTSH